MKREINVQLIFSRAFSANNFTKATAEKLEAGITYRYFFTTNVTSSLQQSRSSIPCDFTQLFYGRHMKSPNAKTICGMTMIRQKQAKINVFLHRLSASNLEKFKAGEFSMSFAYPRIYLPFPRVYVSHAHVGLIEKIAISKQNHVRNTRLSCYTILRKNHVVNCENHNAATNHVKSCMYVPPSMCSWNVAGIEQGIEKIMQFCAQLGTHLMQLTHKRCVTLTHNTHHYTTTTTHMTHNNNTQDTQLHDFYTISHFQCAI